MCVFIACDKKQIQHRMIKRYSSHKNNMKSRYWSFLYIHSNPHIDLMSITIHVPKNVKTLYNVHVWVCRALTLKKVLLYALKTNAPFLYENQPNNIKENFKCVSNVIFLRHFYVLIIANIQSIHLNNMVFVTHQ